MDLDELHSCFNFIFRFLSSCDSFNMSHAMSYNNIQPKNAQDYYIISLVNTVTANLFGIFHLLLYYDIQRETAISVTRSLLVASQIPDQIEHSIVELENFEFHVYKPNDGNLGKTIV